MRQMNRDDYISSVLYILGLTPRDEEIVAEVLPLAIQAFEKNLAPNVASAAILAHMGAHADLVGAVANK